METNKNEFYEYNDNRSIYQPLLFDFNTDKESKIENTEVSELAEIEYIDEVEF